MHRGKNFNLIFLSPTVVNLGFFYVKNFQPYFSLYGFLLPITLTMLDLWPFDIESTWNSSHK